MNIVEQGGNPKGIPGKIVGMLMNRLHISIYQHYFSSRLPKDNAHILDIGCGGGKLIQYLWKLNPSFHLLGIDHSKEMLKLSSNVNSNGIASGNIKIQEASVAKIPAENDYFNMVTALETIQFWKNIDSSFSEIYRTMKADAVFHILNRYPQEGTIWWKNATLKSELDYRDALQQAGFRNIKTDLNFKKNWIIVTALK